jgi:hypothetical protein
LATGAAAVCPAVARCVGEGAATVLVVEEEGVGVEPGLEYDRRVRVSHHWVSSPTAPSDPPSEQQVHSKVSLRRAVDAVQRCGVACVRAGRQGRESGTTGKQPANLAVEGAEESLTILPDCTPTVRPPPKRS